MSNASLTNEQATKLLQELSTNDVFRSRFEEKPAAALVELGIPHETVINLDAACLAPMKIASKAKFADAHKRLEGEAATWCSQMIVPTLRIGNRKR
jgi:putative modified peptide